MNRFNLIRRFFLYFFMSCAGFLIFASVLPACKTSTSKTTKTFLECLESQEDIPLSIWIEAIAQESLQSIPTSEVVLIEEDHLTEIVRQIQTLIVRPNSNHDLVYEELVYTKGMSQENDPKAVQAINALRIENNTQTNLNAMDDEENVLYITNLFERDPLYEDINGAANLLVCNALAHDNFPFLKNYPSYFPFSVEETEDQVILTWSCNDVLELNEAIQDTYLAKAGVRLSNDFEEQIFCTKQGVLQKAQWHTKDSYGLITLQEPSDPSLVQTYFEQLFNPSHAIGDPLEAYPLA